VTIFLPILQTSIKCLKTFRKFREFRLQKTDSLDAKYKKKAKNRFGLAGYQKNYCWVHDPNHRWHCCQVQIFAMIKFFEPLNRSNKQEIPCTTEVSSIFFGCTGSNSRFLCFFIINMKFPIDRVPSCLIFEIWDFGRIKE
jgi:hypothetical protein